MWKNIILTADYLKCNPVFYNKNWGLVIKVIVSTSLYEISMN